MYPTTEEFDALHCILEEIPETKDGYFWDRLTAIDDFIFEHYGFRILFPPEESTRARPAASPPPAHLFNHLRVTSMNWSFEFLALKSGWQLRL
jgi:hypothetical protein